LRARRHLDDRAIAALWSARAAGATDQTPGGEGPEDAHVGECAQCRARYDGFSEWLSDIRAEAIGEADDLFPPERLAVQHAQIVRRLEALERPARVIAFPRFPQTAATARRGPQRWIAAAAAAGLIVGLGAGELRDFRRSTYRPAPAGYLSGQQPSPVTQAAGGALQPAVLTSDDAFLYQSEDASASLRVEALHALDALTPLVRDLDQVR
jgi:hypothetical protein